MCERVCAIFLCVCYGYFSGTKKLRKLLVFLMVCVCIFYVSLFLFVIYIRHGCKCMWE